MEEQKSDFSDSGFEPDMAKASEQELSLDEISEGFERESRRFMRSLEL